MREIPPFSQMSREKKFANEKILGLEKVLGLKNFLGLANENVLRLEISWGFLILGFPNCAPSVEQQNLYKDKMWLRP